MDMKHTDTPWKATTGLNVYAMVPAANKDHAVYGVTESKQIALFYDAHDMFFALRACNSHAALLEFAEWVLKVEPENSLLALNARHALKSLQPE